MFEFPIRLHHHAILAVHPDNVDQLRHLVGTNTLTRFGHKIMTSDLKECDAIRTLYASKMYWKYPDFLSFPDKMYRVRHKHLDQPITEKSRTDPEGSHLLDQISLSSV